jgi:hypothetical protein
MRRIWLIVFALVLVGGIAVSVQRFVPSAVQVVADSEVPF